MEKTVIVLGCAVKSGKPGRIMLSRLQAAESYLKEHEEAKCIVTGAAFGDISEAACMENYLLEHGISQNRIMKEERATSTRENFLYSKELLEKHGLGKSVVIATSEVHVYRAEKLALECGLNAELIPCKTPIRDFVPTAFREMLATIKYWILRGNKWQQKNIM